MTRTGDDSRSGATATKSPSTGDDPATGDDPRSGGPQPVGLTRFFAGHLRDGDELGAMARRVRRCALLLTALAGGLALAWSLSAALTLTAAGLVSSFSFRGLEMQVRSLEPRADGRLDARSVLFIVLRFSLLSAFIVAVLLVGSREVIALILGFSVVPLALLISELAARLAPVRRA